MSATDTAVTPYLDAGELAGLDAYWRAANYLSVGQIYLLDNPLLREPLALEHIKPRLLGHWGTTPGLNLLYAHANRAIRRRGLDMLYVTGPGSRRAGPGREHLARGLVLRALLGDPARRRRDAAAVPPVLVPGRRPQPRRARDARIDPRGRRARLRARPRLRRGVRQPRPDRPLRRRRRRGGDRPARDRLAREQVPRPAARRGRAPRPAPQRLQDRRADGASPGSPRTSSPR